MTNYDLLEIEHAYEMLVATRTPRPSTDQTLTYNCMRCGQDVGDLVAHQDVFHPDVVQARNFRVLQIRR